MRETYENDLRSPTLRPKTLYKVGALEVHFIKLF